MHAVCAGSVVVTIGSSGANMKTASVPTGYTCPSVVSSLNWVFPKCKQKHLCWVWPETFAIMQSGTSLSVKRTDSSGQGWGLNLGITCATSPANMSACDELSDEQISVLTSNSLETCIVADSAGLCGQEQIAVACPVHCGRCGEKPPAWGKPHFLVPSPKENDNLCFWDCSDLQRPECRIHDQIREDALQMGI